MFLRRCQYHKLGPTYPQACHDQALKEELQELVRRRLSTHAYPREIEFVDELPKTPSGKIQRFVLRNRAQDEVPA